MRREGKRTAWLRRIDMKKEEDVDVFLLFSWIKGLVSNSEGASSVTEAEGARKLPSS